jgi:hypothetical protein
MKYSCAASDFVIGSVFTPPAIVEVPLRKLVVSLLFFFLGFTLEAEPQTALPQHVSILQLIATPERYDGKRVAFEGFLHLEFEGNAIFLSQNDYIHRISKNSIWVVRNAVLNAKYTRINSHYVMIAGTFDAANKGHMSSSSGALKDITAVDTWPALVSSTK